MNLFDVYPLFAIEPVKAKGSYLWDKDGIQYLDLYGGHAVISIGHTHPHYVRAIEQQLERIGFYSNSVQIPLQETLAQLLGKLSGYTDYSLFLCNSGAEANENAMKVASFATGRKRMVAFTKAFHGRTSGAVAATDNPKIVSPFNSGHDIVFVPLNDMEALDQVLDDQVAAVLVEGIQGVGGIRVPDPEFLKHIREATSKVGAMLILDEVQSGYGRTGKFFAHQHAGIRPDLITVAKGMGNGFPMGGVLLSPDIKAWHGMLGTTFGGNYLACAAGIAVLEVIEHEKLMHNAERVGAYLIEKLQQFPQVKELRGKGLMIGIDLDDAYASLRRNLLMEQKIFTGEAKPHTIRLLPSLALSKDQADYFLEAFAEEVSRIDQNS